MLELDRLNLEELAEALADQTDYGHQWLINPGTGEILLWTEELGIDGSTPEDLEDLEDRGLMASAWTKFREVRAERKAVQWLIDNQLVDEEAGLRFISERPDPEIPGATHEKPSATAPVQWFALTIDCHDADALAEFYARSFGGEITRRTAEEAWVRAPGIYLVCRVTPDHKPTTWPSPEVPLHSHFEFVVADPDETAEEMRRWGATIAPHQAPDDPDLIVMLDPAGHPVCLIRASAARRP